MESADVIPPFAVEFARRYRDLELPAVYREFITSGDYVPLKCSRVAGLWGFGPADAEAWLDSPDLLDRSLVWERLGLEEDDLTEYHPIAILPKSSQVLVIDRLSERAPVFLLHHETGALHREADSFREFARRLRPCRA